MHPHPELQPDQREPHVFPVLVSIADHDASGARAGKDRKQLRLASGLETHPLAAVGEQCVHHTSLLVDLDGIHCRIAAPVTIRPACGSEGITQFIDPMMEYSGETDQNRQRQLARSELGGQIVQIDRGTSGATFRRWSRPRRVGVGDHMAAFVDVEIPVTPVRYVVRVASFLYGPVGHGQVPECRR